MTNTKVLPPLRLIAASLAILVTGCGTLEPTPFTKDEVKARVEADRQTMYSEQEPVTAPIGFSEAAARALKYNLDYRLKLMENALTRSLNDVAGYEMLPRLVAGAGYVIRNNDSGGRSIGIDDGIETLRPSTSQERGRDLANLTFSWNLLDFGVSYYRAQQKADQVLMAEERRRKVIQNVLQDVRNSYWRALGAQRLLGQVDDLLVRVTKALARAAEAERQGLLPQAQILTYQRALLDAVNLLTLRRQDLELARAELAALMSLPPGTKFSLADEALQALPGIPVNLNELEQIALENRPEIMEEWYRRRVTETDIKAAKALLWPNISFELGTQYDSNRYNYNREWMDAGLHLSWNLLKLTQLPALEKAKENQNRTDDMRRMALSMAVLTQIRVGVQRYGLSLAELDFAEESMRVDQRLLNYARAAAKTQFDSELEVIRAEARALLARYQRDSAYSNAQAAWGRLYNSVGLDVLPETIDSHDVKTLAQSIDKTMGEWQKTVFKGAQLAPKRAEPLPMPVPVPAESKSSKSAVPDSATIRDTEIRSTFKAWLNSWTTRDFQSYANHYAPSFVSPTGLKRDAWLARRQKMIERNRDIQIDTNLLVVSYLENGNARVSFRQSFKSASYQDQVQKTIDWAKQENRWQIVREIATTLDNS